MFTRENISSVPLADAKFQEAKSNYLGQLIVTPEMAAKKIKTMKDNKSPEKKIKAMKDNKSPVVGGIPPQLLMETVDTLELVSHLQECPTYH